MVSEIKSRNKANLFKNRKEGANILTKILTKNYTKVPLFWTTFNLKLYKKLGEHDSCMIHVHPSLSGDDYIVDTMQNLVDYIRDNYEMESLVK